PVVTLPAAPQAPGGPFGSAADLRRRRDLRRMKGLSAALLVLAATVYVVCVRVEATQGAAVAGWVGYLRTAAEAGMVGGLADWFAVTALFRHPLGIPIPHTAIIPAPKDAPGASLRRFGRTSF